jgi:hypothetical protein
MLLPGWNFADSTLKELMLPLSAGVVRMTRCRLEAWGVAYHLRT